jgi:hypothetical protein
VPSLIDDVNHLDFHPIEAALYEDARLREVENSGLESHCFSCSSLLNFLFVSIFIFLLLEGGDIVIFVAHF